MSGKVRKKGSKPSSPVRPSTPAVKSYTSADVSEALTARAKGYANQVDGIITQLQTKDSAVLIQLLGALKQTVSLLGLDNRDVVFQALKVHWTCSDEVTDAFSDFVEHLVSAHTVYVRQVCESVAQFFLPDEGEDQPDGDGEGGLRTKGAEAHNVYRRAHLVLYRVVQVVPTTPTILADILKGHFPHKRRSALRHEVFLRNSLTVTSYVPALRDPMLHLAIHRMLKIDVEIAEHEQMIEEEEEDNDPDEDDDGDGDGDGDGAPVAMDTEMGMEAGEGVVDGHTDMRAASHDLSGRQLALVAGDSVQEAESVEAAVKGPQPVLNEMGHKLDRMMCVLFEYLEVALTGHGEDVSRAEKAEANAALFALLLSIFEEIILPTHKTRYVQFLLFRMCSVDADLPAALVNFLKLKLFNAKNSIVDRQAAACYLASFVARHEKASTQVAADALESMSQWCMKYIAAFDDRCSVTHVNVAGHAVFYTVCQAMMYMFCFRHKALLDTCGLTWVRRLRFSKIVSSNLNPLKVVLPHLTHEFARITRKEEIVYCYSIINRNQRIVMSSKAGAGERLVEAYFPFDPYNLPDSAKHVTDFVEWTSAEEDDVLENGLESGDEDGDDDDEDGDGDSGDSGDESDDEADGDSPLGESYGSDAMAMSVTPDDAAFLMAFQRNVATTRPGSRQGNLTGR